MALSDKNVRDAKFGPPPRKINTGTAPRKEADAPHKLADTDGLYLLVSATGKYWRWNYRYAGKQKTIAYGVYPDTSLAQARQRHREARQQLAAGVDPGGAKKAGKLAVRMAAENSFEAVAGQWFAKNMGNRSEGHKERTWNHLANNIIPWIGRRPVGEIKAPEILECLRRVESRGAPETAHRVRWACSKVFRYAISSGLADADPADLLKEALTKPTAVPFPTITDPVKIGALLRAIDGLQATPAVMCAARLAPLLFVRPGELRQAEWSEIDLDEKVWRIPAIKMKGRAPHQVPLSTQAVAILRELSPLTGEGRYVFPGVRVRSRPMSDATLLAVVRRLGYAREEFTPHSFRKIASTLLNESHLWHRDAIERQLAHGERDQVRAAYNHAEYWPEPPVPDYLSGVFLNKLFP
ncbi:MAG: integrase arm-type DNA-binding domain-containing protein, partial [Telluria sp.]